jgi:hypothetical protein
MDSDFRMGDRCEAYGACCGMASDKERQSCGMTRCRSLTLSGKPAQASHWVCCGMQSKVSGLSKQVTYKITYERVRTHNPGLLADKVAEELNSERGKEAASAHIPRRAS